MLSGVNEVVLQSGGTEGEVRIVLQLLCLLRHSVQLNDHQEDDDLPSLQGVFVLPGIEAFNEGAHDSIALAEKTHPLHHADLRQQPTPRLLRHVIKCHNQRVKDSTVVLTVPLEATVEQFQALRPILRQGAHVIFEQW